MYIVCWGSLDVNELFSAFSMGPKLKHFGPLRVTPPSDLSQCKISDNLEDSCKTLCKVNRVSHFLMCWAQVDLNVYIQQICEKPYTLTAMRSHTLSAHNLQITKYKEIHGQFEILQVSLLKLLYLGIFHPHRWCGMHVTFVASWYSWTATL